MLRGFSVRVLDVCKTFPVIPSQVCKIWYLQFVLRKLFAVVCVSKALCKKKAMLHLSPFSLEMFNVYYISTTLIIRLSLASDCAHS